MSVVPGDPSSRRSDALYAACVALAITTLFVARVRHDLHFPTPWPDEGSFLWQAINLSEYGTLFSPELNPDRDVMWMPPGYMVVTGAVFAVLGFSLELARLLSGLFVAGAILCVALLLREARGRIGHVVLLTAFSIAPVCQLAANTARMEPLVLLLASGAALAASRNRALLAVSTVAMAPLVHPNGVFPAVALIVLVGVMHVLGKVPLRIRRWEWGALATASAAYLAYGVYVVAHLDEFLLDMGTQLAWKDAESKMNGGVLERATQPEALALAVGLSLGAVGLWRLGRRRAADVEAPARRIGLWALVGLAGGFVLQTLLTVGWLYDIYAAYGFILVVILLGEVLVREATSRNSGTRLGFELAVFVTLSGLALWGLRKPFFVRSLARATVDRTAGPAYQLPEDQAAVAGFLQKIPGPIRVQFIPASDSLFYTELRSDGVQLLQPTRWDGIADVYVFHDSTWIPRELVLLSETRMAFQQGIGVPVPRWPIIWERDGTEVWRVYVRR